MVNREALWVILGKLIQLFHDDMTGNELPDGCPWEKFNLSNGVKQGYVLAPVLFNLFSTKVMLHVVRDLDNGIYAISSGWLIVRPSPPSSKNKDA